MDRLRARIRQLEEDNASLSTAAEQAAALAEECAADASRYRSSMQCSDQAVINELKDAQRRKDRRIVRLTTLLEQKEQQLDQVESRVSELEDLKQVAEEMEHVLRASLLALGGDTSQKGDSEFARGVTGVTASVLSAVEDYFPERMEIQEDMAAFRLYARAHVIDCLAERIAGQMRNCTNESLRSCGELCENAVSTIRSATRWCFANENTLVQRMRMLQPGVETLEQRVVGLFHEVALMADGHTWRGEVARMKTDLIVLAIESVRGVVIHGEGAEERVCEIDIRDVCRKRARIVRERGVCVDDGGDERKVEELNSRLNAARVKLERAEVELEDLRVRNCVFEERVRGAVADQREMKALRERVKEVEMQLRERNALSITNNVSDTKAKDVATTDVDTAQLPEQDSPVRPRDSFDSTRNANVPTPLQEPYDGAKMTRLRRKLLHHQLADLHVDATETQAFHSRQNDITIHQALSQALHNARQAASMARVVRLDRETLQLCTRGATMSRKEILQSLAVVRDMKTREWRQKVEHCAELREIRVSGDVKQVVEVLQNSFAL